MKYLKKVMSMIGVLLLITSMTMTHLSAVEPEEELEIVEETEVVEETETVEELEELEEEIVPEGTFDVEAFENFLSERGYQFYPLESISFLDFCSTANLEGIDVELTYGNAGVHTADFNNFDNYEIPMYIRSILNNPKATKAQIEEALIALDQIIISQFMDVNNDTSILFYTPGEVGIKISYVEDGKHIVKKYTVEVVANFIEATAIRFMQEELVMDVGDVETLVLALYPMYSVPTDQTLRFNIEYTDTVRIELVNLTDSYEESTLEKGIRVTAMKPGEATITIKDKSGTLEPAVIHIRIQAEVGIEMETAIQPVVTTPAHTTTMESKVTSPTTGDIGSKRIHISIMLVALVVGGNLMYIKRRKTL